MSHASSLKGWETRRRNARARSRAAKKGWETRRRNARGVMIRIGYAGRDQNSFSLVVKINPYKKLSDENIGDLISKLALDGHFDDSPHNPVSDLRWATFYNDYEIVERKVPMKRGIARLVSFERTAPSALP